MKKQVAPSRNAAVVAFASARQIVAPGQLALRCFIGERYLDILQQSHAGDLPSCQTVEPCFQKSIVKTAPVVLQRMSPHTWCVNEPME